MSNILGIVSGLASAGSAIYGAIRQNKAAKKAQQRQKELQEHAKEQQLDIWNKTNYPQQKAQIEQAGLNPGLLYGMGGTGGATTGSVGAGQAPMEQVYDVGKGMDRAIAAAQVEVAKSQAEKNRAEAEKIKGVDTEQTTANTKLAKITAKFKELETEISGNTQYYQEERIIEEANRLRYEAMQEARKAEISDETYQDTISTIKSQALQAMLGNKLTEQQITNMITQIEQRYEELRLQGQSIRQSKENTEKIAEAMLWGAGINAAGHVVNNVIDIATMPKKLTKTIVNKNEYQIDKNWKKTITETTHK